MVLDTAMKTTQRPIPSMYGDVATILAPSQNEPPVAALALRPPPVSAGEAAAGVGEAAVGVGCGRVVLRSIVSITRTAHT